MKHWAKWANGQYITNFMPAHLLHPVYEVASQGRYETGLQFPIWLHIYIVPYTYTHSSKPVLYRTNDATWFPSSKELLALLNHNVSKKCKQLLVNQI